MIEPITRRGANLASAICDDCGHTEEVTCKYTHGTGNHKPIVGQIIKKLTAKDWTYIKKTLRCPTCEAARKPETQPENEPMTTTTEQDPISAPTAPALRQPTPKQKREIISMLELAWDDARSRFKAGQSDKTVAETVGGGVLWGWVKQIREELFGQDTRNEEAEKLAAELKDLRSELGDKVREYGQTIKALQREMTSQTGAYVARIEAMQRKLDAVLK